MKALSAKAILILLLATLIGVAGCNTMAGFGKDLQKVGDKIEDKADKSGATE